MPAIEKFYSRVLLRKPYITLLILLGFLSLFAVKMPNYKVDASADTLVLEGDKDLEFFRQVAQRYQSEEFLFIAYQPDEDLLAENTLARLSQLVDELREIDGVSSVMSILDVPLLYSPRISITDIGSQLKTLRSNSVDRELVARELVESPIYRQLLSSLDGDTTGVQVNLASDPEYARLLERRELLRAQKQSEGKGPNFNIELTQAEAEFKAFATVATEKRFTLVEQVRETLAQHRSDSTRIYLGGVPMIASDMVAFVQSDLQTFGLGVLLFMVLLLAIIFRAVRWIILPLVSCIAVNVFMLGFLGWLDWRMTVVSSNFVALLLIISLAISVHLIVRYRELEELNPSANRLELASRAVSLMFKPCLFTALTTIVAFGSLVISGIRPIIDFGWMMTIGVLAALLWTFLLVPVGMVLMPAPAKSNQSARRETASGAVALINESTEVADEKAFTLNFARITERHGAGILVVTALLMVFIALGVSQLKVENRFIDYFDESTEIYRGMELIDAELGGTIPLEIMLFSSARTGGDTFSAELADSDFEDNSFDEFGEDEFADDFVDDIAGGVDEFADDVDEFDDDFSEFGERDSATQKTDSPWFTRQGLELVSDVHQYIDSLPETGKVLSLATVYEVAGDLLEGNVDDIQLTLAYKTLPDSISKTMIDPYLNAAEDEARISVRVKETSRTLNRDELLKKIDLWLQQDLGLKPDQYRLTGMLVLYNNMLQSLFTSQILTLGFVFAVITITLGLLFRSLTLGLLAVVPNALAAMLVLGGMGWIGLPLDMMTITIAAISIGIGVDDTIHYVHRFKTEFAQDRNYVATMYRCHGSIGRAMYYTSVTIIFGFSILALSNFNPTIYFGLLTGAAMLFALIGALLLLPRLIIIAKPFGAEKIADATVAAV